MLKNYLKIAIRNLWRNKVFSLINIFGLSTGMACAFLLFAYVQHELSFDGFYSQSEDLYAVQTIYESDNETSRFVYTMGGVASALQKDYPEVAYATRIRGWGGLLSYKDKKLSNNALIYADKSFFKILTYRFLYGNAQDALKNPGSIVLTRQLAVKLFGNPSDAFQKNINLDNSSLLVSGIIEDVPDNTSFPFEAVMPIATLSSDLLRDVGAEGWVGVGCQTLVRLKPGSDYKGLNQKMPELRKYYRESSEKLGYQASMNLVPLSYVRLYDYGSGSGATITYVYILSALAFLILLIASANYMNLSTARSMSRAKEVGIRKVVGSHRWQLMGQFLTESVIFTLFAFGLCLFLVELALPFFNILTNKKLNFGLIFQQENLPLISLMVLSLGLISGLYPAFMLSAFNPVKVLKGKFTGNAQGVLLRKSLVIFQFGVSTVMICCTWLIFRQLQYVQHKEVGFNRQQLVIIPLNDDFTPGKANIFRQKLLENPQIQKTALTNVIPSYNSWSHNPYEYMSEDGLTRQIDLDDMPVGYDYLETMEMNLALGRNFSREIITDSTQACIVNESFVKAAGLKNPLDKNITAKLNKGRKLKIIGVVKDFHLYSLHTAVRPAILFIARNPYNLIARINAQNVRETMKSMEQTWEQFNKKYPFAPAFLDVAFAEQYKNEQRQGQVFISFSILAILIACLGILGLATFAMQQRRKEIGIRKVLGANLKDILVLVSRDFIRLVLLAVIIAIPIAYYFTGQWLQSFAYKIDLLSNWYIFLLAGVIALLMNFLTIGFQAYRATTVNPVEVLKDE